MNGKRKNNSCSASDTSRVSLQDLRLIIEKLKCSQYRPSTAKMYLGVWRQFNKFLMRLDTLPESWEDKTLLFIAHLVHDRKLQSTTVRSYITAIKRMLIDDSYDWQENQLLIRTMMRACRLINDRVVRTRLPIHCGLLEMILFEIKKMFSEQLYLCDLYLAIIALGYYGLMRIGELAYSPHVLKAKDVHLAKNKSKLLILLHSLKTHSSGVQEIKIVSN